MNYHFSTLSFKLHLFLRLRWLLTPYTSMIKNVKSKGLFFDIGCGHGLLTQLLVQNSERQVFACDHDLQRLTIAQKALSSSHKNIEFFQGSFEDAIKNINVEKKFDGIFLIDVIHYLNPNEQESLIKLIMSHLDSDGMFIMREVHPHDGLISQLNKSYEWLMVKLGFTKSNHALNTFKTPEQWKNLLLKSGFAQVSYRKCSFWLFADYLFEARLAPDHTAITQQ